MRGVLAGHGGWVTSIATTPDSNDMILTGSRDKTCMVWDLTRGDTEEYGVARRALVGHDHFVQDIVISVARQFVDHDKDVLSVAFSADNRQIVSGARDKSIKLWNTLGQCKYTIADSDAHTDWVSCVRFSPNT